MSKLNLEVKARQSLVGVGVLFFKNMRVAVNIMLTFIIVSFGRDFTFWGLSLIELAVVLSIIFLIASTLQWYYYYFYVQNEQFIIEKGVLSKDRIQIPFERIQTVNITQNVIQQVLGVVGLTIDTAGSAAKEMEIAALPRPYAQALRDYLLERKQKARPVENQTANDLTEEGTPQESSAEPASRGKLLVHLRIMDLIKVGLTENHLRSGLVLFAVINGYVWQYEEYLLKPFEPFIEKQANAWLAQGLLLIPIAFFAFIIIAVVFSLVQTVLRYYNLQFYLGSSALHQYSGLLKRNEYQVPRPKIQYLKWSSNPLRALIRYRTLTIRQAGSEARADRASVRVPGIKDRQLVEVKQHYYPPSYLLGRQWFQAGRLLFRQRMVWMGIIPSLLAAGALYYGQFSPLFYSGIPLYLAAATYLFHRYQQSVWIGINPVGLRFNKGWVFPNGAFIEYHKLQNVSYNQGIIQQRWGVATLQFYTAAGQEIMPHLPANEAKALYNYCLYRIENSKEKWM